MSKYADSAVRSDSSVKKRDLMKVFWRQFPIMGSMNYERMQGMGFCYAIIPALKKIYGDNKKKLSDALTRHMEAFNVTPACAPFIMGITIAMEEQNSKDKNFDASTINAVKAALMGPLSGIGDTFFWGVFRVIAAGIGVQFSLQGSLLGPVLFLVLFNIPNILARYYGLFLGYKQGSSFIQKMSTNGKLGLITYSASIVGVCVIGSMIASMVNITTPAVLFIGKAKVVFQDIFDQILPKLLPLVATLTVYTLLRKNVKIGRLMAIISIVGFIFGVIHYL